MNGEEQSTSGTEDERISLANAEQVQHWAHKLGVTVEHLRQLVAQVGPRVTDLAARISMPID